MLLRYGLGTRAQYKQPVEHHERRSHLRAGVFLELRLLAPAKGLRAGLEALSEATTSRNRWEFMLTVNPLALPNDTGSPVNPIWMF